MKESKDMMTKHEEENAEKPFLKVTWAETKNDSEREEKKIAKWRKKKDSGKKEICKRLGESERKRRLREEKKTQAK